MKILHIINSLTFGGAQSVLVELLKNWDDHRDQQMVISLRKPGQLSEQIEALNIPIEHIDLEPSKFEPAKFLQLARIIKLYQPDLIQTWLYHADLIGSIAARSVSSAPIIWGIHHTTEGSFSVKPSTYFIIRLLVLLSRVLPSRIICCSHSAYKTHLHLGYSRNKMTTILNGINMDQFYPDASAKSLLRNELGLSIHTKLIGMFARFHPQKDHDTLIQAAVMLFKKRPDIHFVLAGEGIDTSNKHLQEKLSREGIQPNFHLLGTRGDMPYLNAAMNIVTLSSSHGEALPMTLCEAMSSGVPCVATNIGDIASLIGDSGVIVEPNNPQALADGWQAILELPPMKYNALSLQARLRILEFYNLTKMVNEYKFVYHGQKRS